jgi:hypothetical protein
MTATLRSTMIDRFIEHEQLHFHRVGRGIRVSREGLRAYLHVSRR